jgi:hypothetical protein
MSETISTTNTGVALAPPPQAGCWCSRLKRRPYVRLIVLGDEPRHAVGLGTRILNDKASWSTHEPIEPLTQSSPCEGYHACDQLRALDGGAATDGNRRD